MRPWLQLQTKVLHRGSSFVDIVDILGAITRTNLDVVITKTWS